MVDQLQILYIYKLEYNTIFGEEICHLEHQTTKWNPKQDGIFSFAKNKTQTFLTKMSLDGKSLAWNISLSSCVDSSDLLVASCHPHTYAFCSPQNVLARINNDIMKVDSTFSVDEGKVEAIECFNKGIFVLYNDSRIVQYSRDFEYVFSYVVDYKETLPKYNQLRVTSGYLYNALCDSYSNTSQKCISPTIYKWNIVPTQPMTTFTLRNVSSEGGSPEIYKEKTLEDINTVTFRKIEITEPTQNSYFSAVSYLNNGDTVIVYFSGAGNIERSTIGDVLITEIVIPGNPLKSISINNKIVKTTNLRPVSRYASRLVIMNDSYFLVIHGGLSSDYQTVYSHIFSLDVLDGKYQLLKQTNRIS